MSLPPPPLTYNKPVEQRSTSRYTGDGMLVQLCPEANGARLSPRYDSRRYVVVGSATYFHANFNRSKHDDDLKRPGGLRRALEGSNPGLLISPDAQHVARDEKSGAETK